MSAAILFLQIDFVIYIRVLSCPKKESDRIQTVIVAPSDFLQDRLNITVEIICNCGCEINATRVSPPPGLWEGIKVHC